MHKTKKDEPFNPEKTTTQKEAEQYSITESVEIYPAGRSHILAIVKKRVPPKKKEYKRSQPRFTHVRQKGNPQDQTFVEYLADDNRKHIYEFPFQTAREFSHEERRELALSLLATLPRYLGKGDTMKTSYNFPVFLNTQDRNILKKKWRRYVKWRKQEA